MYDIRCAFLWRGGELRILSNHGSFPHQIHVYYDIIHGFLLASLVRREVSELACEIILSLYMFSTHSVRDVGVIHLRCQE